MKFGFFPAMLLIAFSVGLAAPGLAPEPLGASCPYEWASPVIHTLSCTYWGDPECDEYDPCLEEYCKDCSTSTEGYRRQCFPSLDACLPNMLTCGYSCP
jgi:hypothetical protein